MTEPVHLVTSGHIDSEALLTLNRIYQQALRASVMVHNDA